MKRVLKGDCGSGKTIVAALGAAQAIDNGYQTALMAPTEILAEQHFRKIAGWMEPLGIQVAWLTGSLKKREKEEARARIESGEAQLIIGTHSLIQHDVDFAKLGLAIVDEQHPFCLAPRLPPVSFTPFTPPPHLPLYTTVRPCSLTTYTN